MKNTIHRYNRETRFIFVRVISCLCIAALLCCLLALPVRAQATSRAATPQPTTITPPATRDMARAGASIVRLLVAYQEGGSTVAQCTGLGVIVASWPPEREGEPNVWVLTDSYLLRTGPRVHCVTDHPDAQVGSIQVYLSSAYSSTVQTFMADTTTISCSDESCSSGAAVFAFVEQYAEPYIDLDQSNAGKGKSITLVSAAGQRPQSEVGPLASYETGLRDYLIPQYVADGDPVEPGTPLFDDTGELTGMALTGTANLTEADRNAFIQRIPAFTAPHHDNFVHDGWRDGIDDYYKKLYSAARQSFLNAARDNPHFQAAHDYATQAQERLSAPTKNGNTQSAANNGILPLWVVSLLAILILLALIVLIMAFLILRRRHALQSKDAGLASQKNYALISSIPTAHLPHLEQGQSSSSGGRISSSQGRGYSNPGLSSTADRFGSPGPHPSGPTAPDSQNLPTASRIGQRLGNYRLLGHIGEGAFAEVYLGEHVFLKTRAAVKIPFKRMNTGMIKNFLAEARTVAALVHPNIVRVLEFGVEGEETNLERTMVNMDVSVPFLVMDYISGGTLRTRHPKGTRIPLPVIVGYVEQVANALQYAHERRVVHRDVKPENMLLGGRGEILLSDFGIAVTSHTEGSMTMEEMAGTLPYMSPEQIRGRPSPASDQYSLAVVVYEWLCGQRPFQADGQWALIQRHITMAPPPLLPQVPGLPASVEAVVLKALAKEPHQRFPDIVSFARALASTH